MTAKLTERQREILGYIKQELDVDGYPPTVQEIQRQFGFKSPNAVQTHLLALIKKGHIRRRRRKARGLRLVREASSRNDSGNATLLAPPSVTVPPVPGFQVYPPGGAESNQNGHGGAALEFPPIMVEPARITHGSSQPRVCDFDDMIHPLVKWHPSSQGLWLPVSLWSYGRTA